MNNYIWVPDKEHEWLLADIIEDRGETINVSLNRSKNPGFNGLQVVKEDEGQEGKDIITNSTLKREGLCEFDDSHLVDLDDLCDMKNLHEGPLINILRRRFFQNQIYTYAGDILISVNPYKLIPELYEDPLKHYALNDITNTTRVPHVYAIANSALKNLTSQSFSKFVNQSVIISGESGAGKTEASKYMINFLVAVSNSVHSSRASNMKMIVLDSGVIFEAFGNAKTVQNDNSSRFGKYIKLQYTSDMELVSATNETFLLEKSRLITVCQEERNYHVFYQLVRGIEHINPTMKQDLLLTRVEDFKILNEGGCTVINDEAFDTQGFASLSSALSSLGCTADDLRSLWGLLAAILHLGNTYFTDASDSTKGKVHIHNTNTSISHIAKLLGLEETEFIIALTTSTVKAANRQSVKVKTLTVADSTNGVQALIKKLYASIFTWLLHLINDSHASMIKSDRAPEKFLGILDICGFEILRSNSFEQLCINFTNERLQQQFNDSVFASEQDLYKREGILWTTISYTDNQPIIDLIAKKPHGLLNILDEHCMMNRAPDDSAILGLYHQTHGERPDKLYQKPRFFKDPCFTLKHFAGDVVYQIEGFIAKNYDSLQDSLNHLLQDSSDPFIVRVMNASNVSATVSPTASAVGPGTGVVRASKVASLQTVSTSVRSQLDALINTLKNTEPHFVKVIKPNALKAADVFNAPLALTQLRCSDIVEVIRIRRARFQIRIKFIEFYTRFDIFSRMYGWEKPNACDDSTAKEHCRFVIEKHLPPGSYQLGHTLLFLHDQGLLTIQLVVSDIMAKSAVRVQNTIRKYAAKKRCQALLELNKILLDEKKKASELNALRSKLNQEREAMQREREKSDVEIIAQRQQEEQAKETLKQVQTVAEAKKEELEKIKVQEDDRKKVQTKKISSMEQMILDLQRQLQEAQLQLEQEKEADERKAKGALDQQAKIENEFVDYEAQRLQQENIIRAIEEDISRRAAKMSQGEGEAELKLKEQQGDLEDQLLKAKLRLEEISKEIETETLNLLKS